MHFCSAFTLYFDLKLPKQILIRRLLHLFDNLPIYKYHTYLLYTLPVPHLFPLLLFVDDDDDAAADDK